jgi:cytochrome c
MDTLKIVALTALLSGPAFAETGAVSPTGNGTPPEAVAPTGDVPNGEVQFARQCLACHVVANADGVVLAGRNARTGPNLYGVAGREPGALLGYRYGDAMVSLTGQGLSYDENTFVTYVMNPTGWLRAVTADRRARGKMAYQVRTEADARDIYAYLASLAAPADPLVPPGSGDASADLRFYNDAE